MMTYLPIPVNQEMPPPSGSDRLSIRKARECSNGGRAHHRFCLAIVERVRRALSDGPARREFGGRSPSNSLVCKHDLTSDDRQVQPPVGRADQRELGEVI